MPPFRSRSLAVLDRLYDFIGGTRGLSEFDLAGQIQPVHDTSREAELGSRGLTEAGFLMLSQTFAHAAANTIFASTDVYASFDALTAVVDFDSTGSKRHRLWLLDVFGTSDTGLISEVITSARIPVITGAGGTQTQKLARWDRTFLSAESGGPQTLQEGIIPSPVAPRLPTLWATGTIWDTRSVSSGIDAMRISTLWWAGPLGTTPPGMR